MTATTQATDLQIPADPIINRLAARLATEIARAETLQARAEALAESLTFAIQERDQARGLLAELEAQLTRAQAAADDADQPAPAAAARPVRESARH